jgi:anion-transporting  ArsA/GET3 family ATPase
MACVAMTPEAHPIRDRPMWPGAPAATPGLFDRRLIFVLGKGGVGKSVVAAALGTAWARAGQRVVIAEVANQHRLSDLFATREVARNAPTELAPGLFGFSIDVDKSTEEYLASHIKMRPLVDLLVRSRAFHNFAAAAPGLPELVTLGKVWELAVAVHNGEPVWDKVIVDCPATGHGIALLQTAGNVSELAAQGPVREQAHRIEQVVKHPAATGIAIVARPEELPVSEAIEAVATLRADTFPVAAIIMNAMAPRRFWAEDASALARVGTDNPQASAAVHAAVHAALHAYHHATVEHDHLSDLASGTGMHPIVLPDLGPVAIEASALGVLADALDAAHHVVAPARRR